MEMRLRFVGNVDKRLKNEVRYLGRWLRKWYIFPNALEIRLVHQAGLVDFDGTECALRWWQSTRGREAVTAEIAVKSFRRNLKEEGPQVAYPTVIAAIGRVLKYYYQAIRDSPLREDYAERWGDKVLSAYIDNIAPPPPWKGSEIVRSMTNDHRLRAQEQDMSVSPAKKVVLMSRHGYDARHDALLRALLKRGIHLFCAVGEQCELWEEVMDELCVGPLGEGNCFVTTTSHSREKFADVVLFAKQWSLPEPSDVEVIEV